MGIAVLDAQTVGRIAAGEVVERPSSVAKELIENALDAGATAITVEVREGGAKYLRVTDNGCGIAPGEVRLAFENHATSKIRSGDLLDNLSTMGFRGEALPSIASVARVTMTTRQKGADGGVRLKVEGGRFGALEDIGCPEGTTIVVEDLFFNLPARQAFLKKPATEAGAVNDLVQRMILGYPGVAFRYVQNGRLMYHSGGDGNLRHAAFAVYGREVAEKLEIVEGAEGSMSLSGLIGVGELSRPSRSSEYFFINGRSIRCPLLVRTVEEALAGRVLTGQYPICALSLTIPAANVDVNVHPSKLEVRFRDEAMIRLTLETILERALRPKEAMLEAAPEKMSAPVRLEIEQSKNSMLNAEQTKVSDNDTGTMKQTSVFSERIVMRDAAATPRITPAQIDREVLLAYEKQKEHLRALREQEMAKAAERAPDAPEETISSIRPQWEVRQTQQPAGRPEETAEEPGIQKTLDVLPEKSEKRPESATRAEAVEEEKAKEEDVPVRAVPVRQTPAAMEQLKIETPEESLRIKPRVIGVYHNAYILVEAEDRLIMIDQHAAHERILFEKYQQEISRGVAMQTLLMPEVFPATAREVAIVSDNREALLAAGYDAEPLGDRAVQVRAVPYILGKTLMRPLFLEMIDNLDRLKDATMSRRHEVIITASCKHAIKAGEALSQEEIEELVNIMASTDAPPVCAHGRPVIKLWTLNDVEKMFKRT